MKVLIIVTVLALATSTIAVPLSRQAKALALLAAMQDNAEMEGMLENDAMTQGAGPGPFSKMLRELGIYLTRLLHKPRIQEERRSEIQTESETRRWALSLLGSLLGQMMSVLPQLLEGLHNEQKEAGKDATTADDQEIISLVSAVVGIVFSEHPHAESKRLWL